ncbi:hypothetical protein O9X98_05980 [Agrobacterium salinitolerans]|nr:hypothetical protein [Agrobacterium salinitolerans]
MNADLLLTNYGFEKTEDGLWNIVRKHTSTTDAQGNPRDTVLKDEDGVTFRMTKEGRWEFTNEDGSKPFLNFATDDVRDVIAFAQTIIASTIFQVSGQPTEEGFEFDGTFYTSPFMFGPYADFECERIDGEVWAKHPEGEYRDVYVAWRDDFAERVLKGQAAAPDEFHEAVSAAGAKPGI